MPVLRDLYSESKKSASAYLPAYSLSMAAQPLSHHPRRNHLHNTLLRVTMQSTATRNASRPASVNIHRKSGGKRFWPHRLPQTAPEHPETVEIRASKSKWNKLKSAENRYKRAKKVFPISLGARCREFESPISDQTMIIRTTLSKWVVCSDLSFLLKMCYEKQGREYPRPCIFPLFSYNKVQKLSYHIER